MQRAPHCGSGTNQCVSLERARATFRDARNGSGDLEVVSPLQWRAVISDCSSRHITCDTWPDAVRSLSSIFPESEAGRGLARDMIRGLHALRTALALPEQLPQILAATVLRPAAAHSARALTCITPPPAAAVRAACDTMSGSPTSQPGPFSLPGAHEMPSEYVDTTLESVSEAQLRATRAACLRLSDFAVPAGDGGPAARTELLLALQREALRMLDSYGGGLAAVSLQAAGMRSQFHAGLLVRAAISLLSDNDVIARVGGCDVSLEVRPPHRGYILSCLWPRPPAASMHRARSSRYPSNSWSELSKSRSPRWNALMHA